MKHFVRLHLNKIILFILAAMVLAERLQILWQFAFQYLDDDQAVIWFGAKEFSEFRFHEPYFFGQNYNPMLESLLTAPLFWMDVPPYIAAPTITSMLTLFPYFMLSFCLYRQHEEISALLVLSIPLLLPTSFSMMTSMPRGFVTGTFIASLAVLCLRKTSNKSFFFFSFLAFTAMWMNPNALLLVLPMGVYLLLHHYRRRSFYVYILLGAVIPLGIQFASSQFYILHPNYIVHAMWPLSYHISNLTLANIQSYLKPLSPIFHSTGYTILFILFFITLILLAQKKYKPMIMGFIGICTLILCFGINKVHDGADTIFYSHARMFIALPLFMACLLMFIEINTFKNIFSVIILLLTTFFFIHKSMGLSDKITKYADLKSDHIVMIGKVTDVKKLCDKVQRISAQYHTPLVIVSWKHFVSMGCPCLNKKFPRTIEPTTDKRTWRLQEEEQRIDTNLLFIGNDIWNFNEPFYGNKNLLKVSDEPPIYIYRNNTLTTSKVLDSLALPMRAHW